MNQLDVKDEEVYFVDGPLDLTMLFGLVDHLSNKLSHLTYRISINKSSAPSS